MAILKPQAAAWAQPVPTGFVKVAETTTATEGAHIGLEDDVPVGWQCLHVKGRIPQAPWQIKPGCNLCRIRPDCRANIPMSAGAIPDVEELLNDGDSSTRDRRPIMLLLAMVALSRPGAERAERAERHRKAALGGA
ncbi:unnamed protein product [Cladocopium goreaui]|uniref:Uncharacterized protein n=1 Tax=Cladocopium goreaui TaxID=2562237 RepID=A0A9P1GRE9_9DINO|nr:unnamed protein product [Cladocopium goreaui]